MKLFLDTNILLEYFCNRAQARVVEKILQYIEEKKMEGYISVGSFYTIIYLIDGHLKKSGLFNPKRLALLRKILEGILTQFKVVSITDLQSAILDERFSDLEDSCQYYTALSANCDFLLTLNERDFKNVISNRICVLTPERFWTEYMNPIE
ncbi:PIN domain-containing protein [Phocaeicola sp. Sa1CVN1]|uniref:PIN domain-containing protein n=1 Tax=Phocaeicola intestinalis TaxID=2762212 RepID=A0ABR8Y7J7_9BACT|nr:PIN domain-containing protein [Phocaeicola intestinalis]MBD8040184.1 PIN domain-containing protein [Phocaeicola intestinalis]